MKLGLLMITLLAPLLVSAQPSRKPRTSRPVTRSAQKSAPSAQRRSSTTAIRKSDGDTPSDPVPPYFYKPGALIRSSGQLPVYSEPGNPPARVVENGTPIALDPNQAHDVGRSIGVKNGPPDSPPKTTGSGGGSALFGGR